MLAPPVLLYDLVHPAHADAAYAEVAHLCGVLHPGFDLSFLAEVHADVLDLFAGAYPGYAACTTPYHDLEHTSGVFLAMARLLHGAAVTGRKVSRTGMLLGLTAALLHDVGLILDKADPDGTGAKHTVGHEARSNDFMTAYLLDKGLDLDQVVECAQMICCTMLSRTPADIPFVDQETRFLGEMLGSADLLAQTADRAYLEKVLLLFQEFREAGISGAVSELELLLRTEKFYDNQAAARLDRDLGGAHRFMLDHFRARHGLDRDLYAESVASNLEYLRSIHKAITSVYRNMLRRAGIVENLGD